MVNNKNYQKRFVQINHPCKADAGQLQLDNLTTPFHERHTSKMSALVFDIELTIFTINVSLDHALNSQYYFIVKIKIKLAAISLSLLSLSLRISKIFYPLTPNKPFYLSLTCPLPNIASMLSTSFSMYLFSIRYRRFCFAIS